MPDPMPRRATGGPQGCRRAEAAGQEGTTTRGQASRPQGGLDAGTVKQEKGQRPEITLADGIVVDAREAAGVWRDLAALLTVNPDEFRSLLALAQGRPGDADPSHFESLWAGDFLEMDQRTIQPVARSVLLNSYEDTREGPVIAPLRLQDEADRLVAEQALAQRDQWQRDFLFGREDKGRSPD